MSHTPDRFGLYLVLTDPVAGYAACTEAAVAAGVRYVQLRMKTTPRARILDTARQLRAITKGSETRLIVNDDPALASEVGADGAHLGQEDPSLAAMRLRFPNVPIWGLSTHNAAQAKAALALQPSYIGVGPVFPTPSKAHPDPQLGLEAMGRIVASTPLTTVAIGGITGANLPDVLRAGAINFAVIRAVGEARNPADAMARLLDIWHNHTGTA